MWRLTLYTGNLKQYCTFILNLEHQYISYVPSCPRITLSSPLGSRRSNITDIEDKIKFFCNFSIFLWQKYFRTTYSRLVISMDFSFSPDLIIWITVPNSFCSGYKHVSKLLLAYSSRHHCSSSCILPDHFQTTCLEGSCDILLVRRPRKIDLYF